MCSLSLNFMVEMPGIYGVQELHEFPLAVQLGGVKGIFLD